MNIVKIWDGEYPWDVRTEKVARSLTEAGHKVHMVARNRDRRQQVEVLDEATVHRMPPLPWVGPRVNAASMFPAFFNPRWVRLINSVARKTKAEVIVCRDLPLAPTAIFVSRRLSIPVILDMAENYPEMLQAVWDHGRERLQDWVVRNPAAARRIESWVIKRMDHIMVVVEESRDRLVSLGVPEGKITVAANTPLDRRIPDQPVIGDPDGPLRLVYIGLLEAPRGIGVVIEAIARLRGQGVPIQFLVVGDGRDRSVFAEQAEAAGLTPEGIQFLGYLPYDEALEVVRTCHIGIVPHIANASWNSTIPNKLFDYMAAGIPVITSDARPAARIVRETGGGKVYESRDPETLVTAITELLERTERETLGGAGRKAVLADYRWTNDGARLVQALERTVQSRG